MAYNIILSQGRIADRTEGAIPGAALTAKLVEKLISAPVTTIGTPSPVVTDDWSVSLPQARDTLSGVVMKHNAPMLTPVIRMRCNFERTTEGFF